jgi:hypothetical protein
MDARASGQRLRPLQTARHNSLPRSFTCSLRTSSVSRVRGAACDGTDQAGESPVAAIVRFGCAAIPDFIGGRPSKAQAQAKALGAARSDPSGGRAQLGVAAEREHCSVETASREEWVAGYRAAEPDSHMGEGQWIATKATDQCSRGRSGGWVVAPREWSVTENREGLGIAKTRSPSREARPREMPRLADRVVVAEMPRDSTPLAEQRSRGAAACLLKRRPTLHALGPMRYPGHVVDATLRAHQTRRRRGRARPMRSCGPAALKPYWGTPAVRNFRGARGNGATVDAKRARNWKRRTQPSMDLRAIAPCVYSPHPQARVERGLQVTRTQLRVT